MTPRKEKAVVKDTVVQKAEEILSLHSGEAALLYSKFKDLLHDYEKLLHKLDKVITISDKYQVQLKEKTDQLNAALAQLNQLKKIILPICMFCKKIRTDADYWQQIESYFAEHIEVMFSHGICPECMKEKYGAFLANRKE
jgi:diguanylate cyclase